MNNKHKAILVAVILLVQCLGIGWLIYRYERVVTKGTIVRFQCNAYDPYDPFRGRYLQTSVRVEAPVLDDHTAPGYYWRGHNDLFAKVESTNDGTGLSHIVEAAKEPTEDGVWFKPIRSYCHRGPRDFPKRDDETWEEYQTRKDQAEIYATIELPNQLYLNEKVAQNAETILREKVGQAVAVYRVLNHEIVLVDIEIDGTPIRELVH